MKFFSGNITVTLFFTNSLVTRHLSHYQWKKAFVSSAPSF